VDTIALVARRTDEGTGISLTCFLLVEVNRSRLRRHRGHAT